MVKQPNGQAAQKLKPVPRSNAIAGMVLAGAVFLGSIAALITGLVWYSTPDAALQRFRKLPGGWLKPSAAAASSSAWKRRATQPSEPPQEPGRRRRQIEAG